MKKLINEACEKMGKEFESKDQFLRTSIEWLGRQSLPPMFYRDMNGGQWFVESEEYLASGRTIDEALADAICKS